MHTQSQRETRTQNGGVAVEAPLSPTAQTDPIARCTIYRLLSTAFKHPVPETYEEYRNGVFMAEVLDNMSALYYTLPVMHEYLGVEDRLQAALESVGYDQFSAHYSRIFDTCLSGYFCSPHEGDYRLPNERTTVLHELRSFYEQFGLRINRGGTNRESTDHISVEFEFLHFLVFKEAQARQEGALEFLGGYLRAQRDFLGRHLMTWLPAFAGKLKGSSQSPFFHVIAGLAERFTSLDFEAVSMVSQDQPAGAYLNPSSTCVPKSVQ